MLDPGTGALTAVPGSLFSTGDQPRPIAIDPGGTLVFVGNANRTAYIIDWLLVSYRPPGYQSSMRAGSASFATRIEPLYSFQMAVKILGFHLVSGLPGFIENRRNRSE